MNQGKIVEYIEQGKVVCGVCLQDKGSKLHLLTLSNRQINITPKRPLLISNTAMNTSIDRRRLLKELSQAEAERNQLKEQVDVRELWELVRDEAERFDHRYLAQLIFGETATDAHCSALLRALFEERTHFKLKDGRFSPNPGERVEQIQRQREEESLKEERLRTAGTWLRAVNQGEASPPPSFEKEIVQVLKDLALYGNEANSFQFGKEMLRRAGISDIGQARRLLVRLGVWEEDENLDLLRFDIAPGFSERQTAEARRLKDNPPPLRQREDLRELPALTIDGSYTLDYDDAVSLETDGNLVRVGIHITDVAASLSLDCLLEAEAALRASSLYLPCRKVPMIPPVLSEDALSLKQGHERRAISLLAWFDSGGTLTEYRFVPSLIKVKRRLTYTEVNESLSGEQTLEQMLRLARHLRQDRMHRGALDLSLPELDFRIGPDGKVSFERFHQDTPARLIISEFMILYNGLAGRFLTENQVPALFRTQGEPSERLPSEDLPYLYYVFQQRRKLSPLRIHTTAKPHSGLGLDAYVQATSPIRRYMDLVTQRQLHHLLLEGKALWDEEALEQIRTHVEPVIKRLTMIKRNRLRYWSLKFLAQNPGSRYEAIVLDELKTKYRILLTGLLFLGDLKKQNGIKLKPGEQILVEARHVDPWQDDVHLSLARGN